MQIQGKIESQEKYYMTTAKIENRELKFKSKDDFATAMADGFFRIKIPEDLNMKPGKIFAETFPSNTRYNLFGALDVVNGYFQSKQAQTVRFSLESDNWDKCHIDQKEVKGSPNYSPEIQEIGYQMTEIGVLVLQNILVQHGLPEKHWFKATGGSSQKEGSNFLLFNCYDPKKMGVKEGLGAHKDFGHVTVLYAIEPGLEAQIEGVWRQIVLEDGYFTINFGYSLEKLLPSVNASNHRVLFQKEKVRTSIAAFIGSRVGPYRSHVQSEDDEGCVYDWNVEKNELVGRETSINFFERLSNMLYGPN